MYKIRHLMMEQQTELLVGARKGLLVLRGSRGGALKLITRQFAGQVVEYAMRDPRSGRYFAAVTHGQFGPHLYYADDPEGSWVECKGPAFPDGSDASVDRIWVVEPGSEDGALWAGVAPAALFKSHDGGQTWHLNRPLWDVPSRPRWEGGAGGLCLHSICPFPGEPQRLAVGISAAGVWITDDGGQSWKQGIQGLVPRYIPEEARSDTLSYCIHKMQRTPKRPNTLYMQFHGGVYRSDNGGESWIDIGGGQLPSDFGFPLAIDPNNPDRAFVIPLSSDEDRVTPRGKVRVFETRDGGRSWKALSKGLPQRSSYLTIFRQAFCADGQQPLGLYFGAQSGELFGSVDDGMTWKTIARHLPPILSVRCSSS